MNFRFAKYSETISSEKHNFCTTCSHCECAWKIPFRLVSFLPSKVLNKNVSRHFWILHFDEHTDLVQYRVCSRLLRVKAQNTRTHTHIAHIAALEKHTTSLSIGAHWRWCRRVHAPGGRSIFGGIERRRCSKSKASLSSGRSIFVRTGGNQTSDIRSVGRRRTDLLLDAN